MRFDDDADQDISSGGAAKEPTPRPFFLPAGVAYESLPAEVQAALKALIEPAYRELVLGAATALERSAGVTLTFLLCIEVLDQFELAAGMDFARVGATTDAAERERQMARHLRTITAKQQVANFLMRLRIFRAKFGSDPFRPTGV